MDDIGDYLDARRKVRSYQHCGSRAMWSRSRFRRRRAHEVLPDMRTTFESNLPEDLKTSPPRVAPEEWPFWSLAKWVLAIVHSCHECINVERDNIELYRCGF
jgi:hypothetical protein